MSESTGYGSVSTIIEKFNTIYSPKNTPETNGYNHYANNSALNSSDPHPRENKTAENGHTGNVHRGSKHKVDKNSSDSYSSQLMQYASDTLGSGDLRLAVLLPEGGDLHEWVAFNTVDFVKQINMLYGTLIEYCTEEGCPIMSAGPKYEYHWADGQTVKKPIKCSAPKYIDYLMTWVQDQLDDSALFPSKRDMKQPRAGEVGCQLKQMYSCGHKSCIPFPKNFLSIAKTILRRLFRVYAHVYHEHFSDVIQLGEVAHLNTSFKHFIIFVDEFNLIEKRELAPLQELRDIYAARDDR